MNQSVFLIECDGVVFCSMIPCNRIYTVVQVVDDKLGVLPHLVILVVTAGGEHPNI